MSSPVAVGKKPWRTGSGQADHLGVELGGVARGVGTGKLSTTDRNDSQHPPTVPHRPPGPRPDNTRCEDAPWHRDCRSAGCGVSSDRTRDGAHPILGGSGRRASVPTVSGGDGWMSPSTDPRPANATGGWRVTG